MALKSLSAWLCLDVFDELTTLSEPLVGWEGEHSLPISYPIDAFSISDLVTSVHPNFFTAFMPLMQTEQVGRSCG